MSRARRLGYAAVLCVFAGVGLLSPVYSTLVMESIKLPEFVGVVWHSLSGIAILGYLYQYARHPSSETLYRSAVVGVVGLSAFASLLAIGVVWGQQIRGVTVVNAGVVVVQSVAGGTLLGLVAGHVYGQRRLARERAMAREQRLQVLSRVFRHNLRNKLTAASGYVGLLTETDDPEVERSATAAATAIDDLLRTAEVAKEAEKTIGGTRREHDLVTVTERAVERVCEEYADRPACGPSALSVDADATPTVVSTNNLGVAVLTLIENAIEHGAPPVEVAVTRVDDAGVVTVRDHGDGIPDGELRPLRQGVETDLEHTSGVGLWLTYWVAQQSGGEIEFDAGGAGPTAVRLELPLATPDSLLDNLQTRVDTAFTGAEASDPYAGATEMPVDD